LPVRFRSGEKLLFFNKKNFKNYSSKPYMLSQKTKYALKALLYLAQQEEGHIARTIEIADGITLRYAL